MNDEMHAKEALDAQEAHRYTQLDAPIAEPWRGVGDSLQESYTIQEQYAIIEEAERLCGKYLDPDFDALSFLQPSDNLHKTSHIPSRAIFTQEGMDDKATPLITIAIPTYARVSALRRAIISALAQEQAMPYEIIVVENPQGSRYLAESMMKEFASKCSYYQNASNLGGFGNFNRCLTLARGQWVCLLHSDDELLPHYVRIMQGIISDVRYKHAMLIGSIEESFEKYPYTRMQRLFSAFLRKNALEARQMRANVRDGFCWLPPRSMLHNRVKCLEIGGYNEDETPSGDMIFFNRAAIAGEVFCYRGEMLTRNHYEISSCNDPHIALMMILQNPQMFLGFSRTLTYAHIMGNFAHWGQYFAHLPLLCLYARRVVRMQMRLFGLKPSFIERCKMLLKERCQPVFMALKALKTMGVKRPLDPVLHTYKANATHLALADNNAMPLDAIHLNNHANTTHVNNHTDTAHLNSPPPPPLNSPLLFPYIALVLLFNPILSAPLFAPSLRRAS